MLRQDRPCGRLEILSEKIHDNRFIRLIDNLFGRAILEDWQFHATYSGVPQGGVIAPPTILQTVAGCWID